MRTWTKRDPVKNYFPLPNEIYQLGLSHGAIAVYGYLLRIEDRRTYAKYIALRPRAERLGEHGLFGDDDAVDLAAVADELDHYTGNVWTHIISLHREDAERLGYDHADTWRTLLRTHRNDIAAAMKIPPEDFRWYAAFHDEGNHPHVHIYTHITGDMQRAAAACIDRSIGKAEPQKEAEPKQKGIVDFQPYVGKKRKPGTGCVSELNDHLFEGRYSPIWPDGTQHSRNVYARTREECEEKLKELITEMNEERKNLKEQLAGIAPPEKLTKKQRKLWDYMRLHPEVTEFSTIAKRTGLARNTVKKHYGMVAAMLGRK